MILAAYTLKNIWFYAPAMLLSVTAIFRVISWAAHDATFATQFIIIEIVLVALLITSRKVAGNNHEKNLLSLDSCYPYFNCNFFGLRTAVVQNYLIDFDFEGSGTIRIN